MKIFFDYFYTLIQLTGLELLTYLLIWPLFLSGESRKKIVAMILPMNAITYPLFFFFIMGLPINFLANILIGELIVIVAEAFFLKKIFKMPALKAFALSAIVNLVSWQLGPLLTFLIKT
jgi:hypothetical protein